MINRKISLLSIVAFTLISCSNAQSSLSNTSYLSSSEAISEIESSFNSENISVDTNVITTDSLVFTLLDTKDGYSVKAINSEIAGEIIVPETINNLPILKVEEDAFSQCTNAKSISIPDSVVEIYFGAFNGCRGLEKISLPFIGKNNEKAYLLGYIFGTFNDTSCKDFIPQSLKTIILGKKCQYIVADKFVGGYSIEEIIIHPDNPFFSSKQGVVYNKEMTSIIFTPHSLKGEITIPETVTEIGNFFFNNCSKVEAVTLPNNLQRIGDSSFHYCRSLTSITIPDSVTYIGKDAFSDCENLTDVILSDNLKYLGDYAFFGCALGKDIDGGLYVGSKNNPYFLLRGINDTSVASFTINPNCKILNCSFFYCTELLEIKIPNSVVCITNSTFQNCRKLKSIIIPDSVMSIGQSTFESCQNLEFVSLSKGMDRIEKNTFNGCKKLSSIIIPAGITSVDSEAFAYTPTTKNIFYKGNAEQWSSIISNKKNYQFEQDIVYYYAEEKPSQSGRYWHYNDNLPVIWEE